LDARRPRPASRSRSSRSMKADFQVALPGPGRLQGGPTMSPHPSVQSCGRGRGSLRVAAPSALAIGSGCISDRGYLAIAGQKSRVIQRRLVSDEEATTTTLGATRRSTARPLVRSFRCCAAQALPWPHRGRHQRRQAPRQRLVRPKLPQLPAGRSSPLKARR
jgi:hypothetical protein